MRMTIEERKAAMILYARSRRMWKGEREAHLG